MEDIFPPPISAETNVTGTSGRRGQDSSGGRARTWSCDGASSLDNVTTVMDGSFIGVPGLTPAASRICERGARPGVSAFLFICRLVRRRFQLSRVNTPKWPRRRFPALCFEDSRLLAAPEHRVSSCPQNIPA